MPAKYNALNITSILDMAQRSSRRRSLPETDCSTERTPSTECTLCHHPHREISCPDNWSIETARKFAFSVGVSGQCPICGPCRRDITKCMKDGDYKPRWVTKETTKCAIKGCTKKCTRHLDKPQELVEIALSQNNEQINEDITPVPTPLCTEHYHSIYNIINPKQCNCVTCNTSLRYTTHRQCPDPYKISKYLRQSIVLGMKLV